MNEHGDTSSGVLHAVARTARNRNISNTEFKHLIRRMTAELNIAYNKVPLEGDNYTVDHSTQLVLINPRGHYHGFFKAPHGEVAMRQTWRSITASYERQHD